MFPFFQSGLPTADFIFDMSNSWLMSVSSPFPCRSMVCALSLTSALPELCSSRLSPRITVSGVRNSCVMLVKKFSRSADIRFSS